MSASVNKVIVLGNLGRDPEVRYLNSGEAVANIAVATSYKSKDRNTGEQKEQTEWHRVAFFGKLAEIVGQYLKKGSSVYVEGRLQTRKYTDKDGVEKYATDIIAENMQMLGSRTDSGQGGYNDMGYDQAPPQRPQQQQRQQGGYDQGGQPGYAQASGRPNTPPQQRPQQRPAPDFSDDIPF